VNIYYAWIYLFVDLDRLAGTEIKKPTALRRLTWSNQCQRLAPWPSGT